MNKCGDLSPFKFPSGQYRRESGRWIPLSFDVYCSRECGHKDNHRHYVSKDIYFSWPQTIEKVQEIDKHLYKAMQSAEGDNEYD